MIFIIFSLKSGQMIQKEHITTIILTGRVFAAKTAGRM